MNAKHPFIYLGLIQFLSTMLGTSFIKFIPNYLIIFNTIINRIFFISFSDCLFQEYRNKIVICILIIYPASLLNLFIIS